MEQILLLPPGDRPRSAFYRLGKWYQESGAFREYLEKFLERDLAED